MHPISLRQIFDWPATPHDALVIALKTSFVYVFLVAGLRLLGKRELGQMNIYDLILIIVLGNAVQNAMMNNDSTLGGGIIASVVLLVLNRAFSWLIANSRKVEKLMVGEPILIATDGKELAGPMEKEGVTHEQLLAAVREHGMMRLDEVKMAVLEVDGTISVVPKDSKTFRTRRHFKALRLP